MKKSLFGILAVVLAVTLSAFDFKGSKATLEDPMNWYPTDAVGEVTSTLPVYVDEVKSNVKILENCSDVDYKFCYYGTLEESLPENFDASGEPPAQIIKRNIDN